MPDRHLPAVEQPVRSATRPQVPRRGIPTGIVLAFAASLAGCATVNDWLNGKETPAPETVTVDSGESSAYIQELFELTNGDPATQAEIFADARAAARLTPNTSSRLRYALVLAVPGHASSNPEEAQSLLRDILSQPELLSSAEKSLATIWLRDVETRLVLNAEARRMRAEAARTANSENAVITDRITDVEAENRELRQALAEAEQKLEAITTIERSIREQSDEATPQQ